MSSSPLEQAVRSFIAAHVASAEELAILIHLVCTRDRWWDASSIAEALGLSALASRSALDALAARNLLDIRITAAVRYRFRPATVDLERVATALVASYRRDPGAVVRLIAGASGRTTGDVADAVTLRPTGHNEE